MAPEVVECAALAIKALAESRDDVVVIGAFGEAMHKASQEAGENAVPDADMGDAPSSDAADDSVVDADFEEVEEDNKDK